MVWCSGWELASAVSNAGGLGLIGAGSMDAETLRYHIRKTRENTKNPFGVNVPLLYSRVDELMKVIIEEKVSIVFTSAGNPSSWTSSLKEKGCLVVHVVSNVKFAKKAQEAGVDALVAEGVEAGGHNGREETTTMVLVPLIKETVSLPLIAAGGIASGQAMLAALALGADGVQIGSRFVASIESSAHLAFKNAVINTTDGSTKLVLRSLNPVRLIRNNLCHQIEEAENRCVPADDINAILGKGLSKRGMFEGDIENGEMEIGQVAAGIHKVLPAKEILATIIQELNITMQSLSNTIYEKN